MFNRLSGGVLAALLFSGTVCADFSPKIADVAAFARSRAHYKLLDAEQAYAEQYGEQSVDAEITDEQVAAQKHIAKLQNWVAGFAVAEDGSSQLNWDWNYKYISGTANTMGRVTELGSTNLGHIAAAQTLDKNLSGRRLSARKRLVQINMWLSFLRNRYDWRGVPSRWASAAQRFVQLIEFWLATNKEGVNPLNQPAYWRSLSKSDRVAYVAKLIALLTTFCTVCTQKHVCILPSCQMMHV